MPLRTVLAAALVSVGLSVVVQPMSPAQAAPDPGPDTVQADFEYAPYAANGPGHPAYSTVIHLTVSATSKSDGSDASGTVVQTCPGAGMFCRPFSGTVECLRVRGGAAILIANGTFEIEPGVQRRVMMGLLDGAGTGAPDRGDEVQQLEQNLPCDSYEGSLANPATHNISGGDIAVADTIQHNTKVGVNEGATVPSPRVDGQPFLTFQYREVTESGFTAAPRTATPPAPLPSTFAPFASAAPVWDIFTDAVYRTDLPGGPEPVSICYDRNNDPDMTRAQLLDQMFLALVDGQWVNAEFGGIPQPRFNFRCGRFDRMPEALVLGQANDLAISPHPDVTLTATDADGARWDMSPPPIFTSPFISQPSAVPCDNRNEPYPIGTTHVVCSGTYQGFSNTPTSSFNVTVTGAVTTTTPVGNDVLLFPPDQAGHTDVGFTFDNVTVPGTTTVTTSTTGPTPTGFQVEGNPPVYYNLTSSATFTGSVEVCVSMDDRYDVTEEEFLARRLFHYTGGQWVNITSRVDRALGLVCGETTTFSPFVVGSPQSKPNDLTIAQQADLIVPATGPNGATVTYPRPRVTGSAATVPTASCAPASGGRFAIGTTTVTCTATSPTYANSPTTMSFRVVVQGAAAQLTALRTSVIGVGVGKTLQTTVEGIQSNVAAGKTRQACNGLLTFAVQVAAQVLLRKVAVAKGVVVIAAAARIAAVLKC